jgi:hypothetical protein
VGSTDAYPRGTLLVDSDPELAAQFHPTLNASVSVERLARGSGKKIWWLGTCDHAWEATILSRSYGAGCPFCSGRSRLAGINDLATLAPDLAAEWHPSKNGELTPNVVGPESNKKVWWLGACDHDWEATIQGRSRGDGCPFCSGRSILAGYNDLATLAPDLAAEWHPDKNGDLTPSMVGRGSEKKVWWQGACGHAWDAMIYSRSVGSACPVCRGLTILAGYNDLATLAPDLAAEWHPDKNGDLTPSMVGRGSGKKAWWRGTCGHEWGAEINSRSAGRGCPVCRGLSILVGFNDLATLLPALAAEWHPDKNAGLTPRMVTQWSGKRVWWRGTCGHAWDAVIANRSRGVGCPFCVGQSILAGFNDLATSNPFLAAEWHPTKNGNLGPDKVGRGSPKKIWWRGTCEHEWASTVLNRTAGNGCPSCSMTGFKPNLPAYVYFLEHPELYAFKVGITNVGTKRLSYFKQDGWKVLNLERFENGTHAFVVEGAIKRWWRVGLGLPIWLGPEDMPRTSGWTETVHSAEVTVVECIARINLEASIVRALGPLDITELVADM